MSHNYEVELIIDFTNETSDERELEEFTQQLLEQLECYAEVMQIERIREQLPEELVKAGDESLGKLLAGFLKTRIKLPGIATVMKRLSHLLPKSKEFKITIKGADGRELGLTGVNSTQREMAALIKQAKDFLDND